MIGLKGGKNRFFPDKSIVFYLKFLRCAVQVMESCSFVTKDKKSMYELILGKEMLCPKNLRLANETRYEKSKA